MIGVIGDIHGETPLLCSQVKRLKQQGASCVIQVGDFGVSKWLDYAILESLELPVYFIDGNHEDYRIISTWSTTEPTELVPGKLTYVPRGSVLYVEDKRIGFLGGAGSIDYNYRSAGFDWFPEAEQITDAQVERLLSAREVDVLITHTPPRELIQKFFDSTPEKARNSRAMFGAALNWVDPSADKVQFVWEALGRPRLYCGHMHRSIYDANVSVLNIGEGMVL